MSNFITVESENFSFQIFPSARVPLVYKKKFDISLLKDAENAMLDPERAVFLVHQCYLAKCRVVDEKTELTEDDLLDKLPATVLVKQVINIIKSFTDEIEAMNPEKEGGEKKA